jgi:hypothetical protein
MAIESYRRGKRLDPADFAASSGYTGSIPLVAGPGLNVFFGDIDGPTTLSPENRVSQPIKPPETPAQTPASPKKAGGIFAKLSSIEVAQAAAEANNAGVETGAASPTSNNTVLKTPPAQASVTIVEPSVPAASRAQRPPLEAHPSLDAAIGLMRKAGAVFVAESLAAREVSVDQIAAEVTLGIERIASAARAIANEIVDDDAAKRHSLAMDIGANLAAALLRAGVDPLPAAAKVGKMARAAALRVKPDIHVFAAASENGIANLPLAIGRASLAVLAEAQKFAFCHPQHDFVEKILDEIVDVSFSCVDESGLPFRDEADRMAYASAVVETNTDLYLARHRIMAERAKTVLADMTEIKRAEFEKKGLNLLPLFQEFRHDAACIARIVSDKTRRLMRNLPNANEIRPEAVA